MSETVKLAGPDQPPQISPYLLLVNQILADVAKSYEADISTLFRVSGDRTFLVLEAVYDNRQKMEIKGDPYTLQWPDPDLDNRRGHGVTCWVAEHGEALFMPDLNSLRSHPAYAGAGQWDGKLFPNNSVADRENGFGCFYAVPLSTGPGLPRDTVIGVFKIERRRNRPVFDTHEMKAFDLAATSISRTLQQYQSTDTTLRRVLSEAAHILRGRLSDSRSVMEMCVKVLESEKPNVSYVRSHLPNAESLLRASCARIERVLEAYRGNPSPSDFKLEAVVAAAIEAGFADQNRCKVGWETPPETTIRLTSVQRYDLETVLLNLLRNADQHSKSTEPVQLHVRTTSGGAVEFRIIDQGVGLPPEKVERAKEAAKSGVQEEALLVVRGTGTGLRRVFHFAKEYDWAVVHDSSVSRGTAFIITIPGGK